MIEHYTHLITQVWTCFFYYALLNGISWNQKHPHLVTALGDLKKRKENVKMKDGYIPMLNTELSSCHVFPKRTEYNFTLQL